MTDYKIEWDDGNWPKCGKHGVSKEEIEAVFENDPTVFDDPDHSTSEPRYKAIGTNNEGRFIFTVFTFRVKNDGDYIRPISARYMHGKEIKSYGQ